MPSTLSRIANKLDPRQSAELEPKKAADVLVKVAKQADVMAAARAERPSASQLAKLSGVAERLALSIPSLRGILAGAPIRNVSTNRSVSNVLSGLKERAASPKLKPGDAEVVSQLVANIESQQAADTKGAQQALARKAIAQRFSAADACIRNMQMGSIKRVDLGAEADQAVSELEFVPIEADILPREERQSIREQMLQTLDVIEALRQ